MQALPTRLRPFLLILLLTYAQEDVNTTNETFILPYVESRVEAIPTTVQACGELVFSGAKSFDSRGDPLQFFWGFGPGTPSWFRTPRLSTLLEEATAMSADSVVVSPWVLSEAGARLGEELREGEVRLEVRLIVRNALGNSTEAVVSAGVVGSTAQAEPVIFPVGSNDVQLKHSERLILSVVTSEAPFALACALRDPGKSAGRTNVTWEYSGFGQAFRALEDVATSNPLMRDLSEDPNTVELVPYALQPGSFHLLRAVAAFDTRPTLAPRANVVFRIAVESLPPLEVHIIGPRVASQCGFELDASQVWDPTLPSSNLSDFLFEWRCSSIVQVGELDICANLPGLGAAGPRLMVGPGLLPGVHRFSVFVRRKTGGPSAVARNPVRVENTSFATLSLKFPRYAYTGKLNLTDGIPPVSAVVDASGQAGAACLVPEVHWQWVLVEDRLLPRLDRILPTRAETVGNMLELQSDVGDDGLLLPSVPYYHVLLQSDNQSTLAAAVAGVLDRPPLENVLRNGVVAAIISPKFLAEEPPSFGSIAVQPSFQGLSLGTTFLVETSMWADERPAELEYQFVAFPLQDLKHLLLFCICADPLPNLQIDWEDPQHPQYWKELGGQLLRPWGRLPQALVHMPAGLYQLVVRARDDEGAVAMTSSPEPLIVEAEQNFTVPYVEAVQGTTTCSRDFIDSANCNSRRLLAMARQCRLSGGFLVLAALLCVSCRFSTTYLTSPSSRTLAGRGPAASHRGARGAPQKVCLHATKAEKAFEEFKEMKQDYDAMLKSPHPRNAKRVGNQVWFDVSLALPLGLALDTSWDKEAVGVSQVAESGTAFAYNQRILAEDSDIQKMWIQPGDRLLMLNGQKVKTQEDVVEIVSKLKEGDKVILKLSREARGPIQVVFPEPAEPVVVRPSAKLQDAARAAGHNVIYACEDGLCGSCWHVSEKTGDIYQLCLESVTATDLPSKAQAGFTEQIGGVVQALAGNNQWEPGASWDNTEPLRLRPCPEIYEKFMNPHMGKWQYDAGKYKVTRDDDDRLIYVENKVQGFLVEEDEDDPMNRWLTADLGENGQIRIRLSKSLGRPALHMPGCLWGCLWIQTGF
ncbi:unnamed protein product [Symbiodinium microadriaticum]|nr:unnamed protein product [Symbiodinium microadriaticum]